VTADPTALEELQKIGLMTTPVSVIDGKVIIGFDPQKLKEALQV